MYLYLTTPQLLELEVVGTVKMVFLNRDGRPVPADGARVFVPKRSGYSHQTVANVVPGANATEVVLQLLK